jgi:hypothetical protein
MTKKLPTQGEASEPAYVKPDHEADKFPIEGGAEDAAVVETKPDNVAGEPDFETVKEAAEEAQSKSKKPTDEDGREIITTPEQRREADHLRELIDSASKSENKLLASVPMQRSLVIGNKANKVLGKLVQALLAEMPFKLLVLLADGNVSQSDLKDITDTLARIAMNTLKEEYKI